MDTTGPLLPDEVLRSSALTFPSILESFEREAAARSDQLSADGAFDLMLKGEYYDRLTGFYSGGFGKVEARQPLRPYGAEVFGSYRVSNGTFPTYENYDYTNQLGEVKVGALFSLLRNRDIDSRRFAIEDTRLAASQARLDVLLVQLNVQHEALRAYWRWVAAGEEIRVFEELLEIAEARQIGLTREVNEGARARIALTENEQNLLRRRSLLEEAKRNFLTAANSLGYYLRGSDGRMVIPTREMLPDLSRMKAIAPVEQLVATPLSDVIQSRPELQTFKLALERANNRVALRRNDLEPSLNASVELSRDFGQIGPGGPGFDSTDTVVGLTFSVPLQRRTARGAVQRGASGCATRWIAARARVQQHRILPISCWAPCCRCRRHPMTSCLRPASRSKSSASSPAPSSMRPTGLTAPAAVCWCMRMPMDRSCCRSGRTARNRSRQTARPGTGRCSSAADAS